MAVQPKVLPSARQDEIRRATKKRGRRKSGGVSPMDTGPNSLLGMIEQSARRQANATRKAEQEKFRLQQAVCALELVPRLINTQLNQLEREEIGKIAASLINEFVEVEAFPEGFNRTGWAQSIMCGKLTEEQRNMPQVVKTGIWAARTALKQAYEQLTSGQTHGAKPITIAA